MTHAGLNNLAFLSMTFCELFELLGEHRIVNVEVNLFVYPVRKWREVRRADVGPLRRLDGLGRHTERRVQYGSRGDAREVLRQGESEWLR